MFLTSNSSPAEALASLHDQLKLAGTDKNHGFRFFSVATLDAYNQTPETRLVVLRSFSENWEFEFYTDIRSDKITQIRNHPVIQALFWDASKKLQVRISADSTVHHKDKAAYERWKHVQGEAQKAYSQRLAPGTKIDTPSEAHQWPEKMTDDYFAVIRSVPNHIKILQLSGMEHLSLEFHRQNAAEIWSGGWIAP